MDQIATHDAAGGEHSAFPFGNGAEQPPAWTMIEHGRYQPRRIRGSCLGRELG
jgi:hypothetical protein